MFQRIACEQNFDGSTRATLDYPEMGLRYLVEFHPTDAHPGFLAAASTQLLSRVHAVAPSQMKHLPAKHTWSTGMHYRVVVMDQHLPRHVSIDCSDTH